LLSKTQKETTQLYTHISSMSLFVIKVCRFCFSFIFIPHTILLMYKLAGFGLLMLTEMYLPSCVKIFLSSWNQFLDFPSYVTSFQPNWLHQIKDWMLSDEYWKLCKELFNSECNIFFLFL